MPVFEIGESPLTESSVVEDARQVSGSLKKATAGAFRDESKKKKKRRD